MRSTTQADDSDSNVPFWIRSLCSLVRLGSLARLGSLMALGSLVGLATLIPTTRCHADQSLYVLSSAASNVNQSSFDLSKVASTDIASQWKIHKRTLHGGKQEGVSLVKIDNGMITVSVVPTRGMSILSVEDSQTGERIFGWDSPVKEVVHPSHIDLESRGGLGWLEGFNEWMVRCGLEFAGHPGKDKFINNTGDEAEMDLTLHGKIGNIPASEVELLVQNKPPYRVTLRGVVSERMFYGPKLKLVTELSLLPNSDTIEVHDVITNEGASGQEYQVIYHTNFGAPLLEQDARVVVAAKEVWPMNETAAAGISDFDRYREPQVDFVEQVYLVTPHTGADGTATAVLMNAAGDRGASMTWSTASLPHLTIWKNTAAVDDGYVTGIEPGSGFPFNRRVERHYGRVPKLAPGQSTEFDVSFSYLRTSVDVQKAAAKIKALSANAAPTIHSDPPKNPFAD